MGADESAPAILGTWNRYVDAYEHLLVHAPGYLPGPTAELMRAFAGALAASVTGGVADPLAGGEYIVLPGGEHALVVVASGPPGHGVRIADHATASPGGVAIVVVFEGLRARAMHLVAPHGHALEAGSANVHVPGARTADVHASGANAPRARAPDVPSPASVGLSRRVFVIVGDEVREVAQHGEVAERG